MVKSGYMVLILLVGTTAIIISKNTTVADPPPNTTAVEPPFAGMVNGKVIYPDQNPSMPSNDTGSPGWVIAADALPTNTTPPPTASVANDTGSPGYNRKHLIKG